MSQRKRGMALLLAALLCVPCCALADGFALDLDNNEFRTALNGRVKLQSRAYRYPGYVDADGFGQNPYDPYDALTIQIITKSASVWSEPKTNSKKLGSASHGDKLTCEINESGFALTQGDFFAVDYKGKIGYVNRRYAVISPLEIVLMESNVPAYIAPDTSAKCVGSLSKHTRLTVVGMYEDFYIVNLRDAAVAFISKYTRCYDSRFEDFYLSQPTETGTIIRKTALRTGPGESYAKVADVKPGDTFEFYDMINAWHMLRYTPKGSDEPVFVFVYCNDVDVPIANG